ncbi:MAG: CarD family transcriptional regulator, partial [Firmicutes bacterium]|nr:CarD family transcriptional regulator [Bacillota bacterium]
VEGIEKREVAGQQREYYMLNLPFSALRVMVPLEEAENIGLRDVMSAEDSEQVLRILEDGKAGERPAADKWSQRFRSQMGRIKTGDVYELAEIVCSLNRRDRRRPLAAGEKKLFEQAREILLSELWLVCHETQPEVLRRAEELLQR